MGKGNAARKDDSRAAALPQKSIKQEMMTLRLDEPTMNWLREMAQKKGLGASTLARMWLLERLAQEGPPSTGEWYTVEMNLE